MVSTGGPDADLDMVGAYTRLSRLLENTPCSFEITEVGRQGQPLRCLVTVIRFAPLNEFPAYDEEICQVETSSWPEIVQCISDKIRSGEIPRE